MDLSEHLPMLTRFALALLLSLLLPRLVERYHIPGPVGFLLAGVIIGPHVLGIVKPDGPVAVFFSDLGKMLLMFFAGFEVDMIEFSRCRKKCILFVILTFMLPFLVGVGIALAAGYQLNAMLVVGAMLAPYTLGLPIIKEANLTGREPMLVVISGTVFVDILAFLMLAICIPIHISGFSLSALVIKLIQLAIFISAVLFGLSWVARAMLARYGKSQPTRVVILMLIMAIAAQAAELINLEGIVGAFMAGIAVQRAFREYPAENALEVISEALFIPAFFMTAGFLIDFKVLYMTLTQHPLLVVGIVGGTIAAKYFAAYLAGRISSYERNERLLMFALSTPHVAAALAMALVAYKAVNAAGLRLIDEPMLNAMIVLVIITSILGLMLTARYAERLKLFKSVIEPVSGSQLIASETK